MAAKERWRLLTKSCTSKPGDSNQEAGQLISRVAAGSFGFVTSRELNLGAEVESKLPAGLAAADSLHHFVSYSVSTPCGPAAEIVLKQRRAGSILLADHQVSQTCGVDSTGVVCLWPSEEVMTHYCVQHPELFRSKRVVELGAGYGLAGLAIAACTDAREVVLTDGNPQVVEILRYNVRLNAHLFGGTSVSVKLLLWGEEASLQAAGGPYDVIIAADCTFFKDYHAQLADTIKCLLTPTPAPATSSLEMPELEDSVEDAPTASATSDKRLSPSSQAHTSVERPSGGRSNGGISTANLSDGTTGQYCANEGLAKRRKGQGNAYSENGSEGRCRGVDYTSAELTDSGGDLQGSDLKTGIVSSDETNLSSQITVRSGHNRADEIGPRALLFNPKRGGTLDRFVGIAMQAGLSADISPSFDEEPDPEIVKLKGGGCAEWPGYTEEHCRPHLLTLHPLPAS